MCLVSVGVESRENMEERHAPKLGARQQNGYKMKEAELFWVVAFRQQSDGGRAPHWIRSNPRHVHVRRRTRRSPVEGHRQIPISGVASLKHLCDHMVVATSLASWQSMPRPSDVGL